MRCYCFFGLGMCEFWLCCGELVGVWGGSFVFWRWGGVGGGVVCGFCGGGLGLGGFEVAQKP